MKFTIIIPCYNEKESIDTLLKNILTIQKEYALECILVENGSTDETKKWLKKY